MTSFSKEQIAEIFASGAVGIDLGTTYSAVAAINEAGRVEVLTNCEGTLITPSVVLFDEDGSTIVGEQARLIGQGQSGRVIECVKRVIGQPGMEYEIDGKTYTPEGISAIILGKLVKDAAERLGRAVKSAVITVPAWFNDEARQATQRAGKAAGLNVLGILSEPSAAALAYGVQTAGGGRTAFVFDLGGGTFDVSVIRISDDGQIDELARDGDVLLGGKDWDERIVEKVCDAWSVESGSELPPDCDAFLTLSIEAERAKKRLTDGNQARIFLQHDGQKLTFRVTREEFDEWTADLTARTEETVNTVLSQAGLTLDQIDVCLPVGGSTRMSAVRGLLEKKFPGRVDHTVEKDQVVAIGACLYMAKKLLDMKEALPASQVPAGTDNTNLLYLPGDLQDNLRRTNVIQVSSRSYGIGVLDGDGRLINDHFIRTNQRLPLVDEKTYYTRAPNQRTVEIPLLEGDSTDPDQAKELIKRSCPLPSGLSEGSPLHLRFTFTEEGMITIHVREPSSGNEIELAHAGGVMTPEEEAAVTNAIRVLE